MAAGLSAAGLFFKKFLDADPRDDYLRSLVTSPPTFFEEEWIDFKSGCNASDGSELPDDAVRKIWSKALSAFANTSGGILVWGIDARKDPRTRVDAASGFNLVPNPAKLKTRLMEIHHQATDPPTSDVQVEIVEDTADSPKGFVVCHIPESEYKPHRAEFAGRTFYLRYGDDFVVPGTAILRSMFYPRARSNLRLVCQPYRFFHDGGAVGFEVKVRNDGPATAQSLAIRAECDVAFGHAKEVQLTPLPAGKAGCDPYETNEVWSLYTHNKTDHDGRFFFKCTADAGKPLHPGDHFDLFRIEAAGADRDGHNEATISASIFATDREPEKLELKLSRYEFINQDEYVARVTRRG